MTSADDDLADDDVGDDDVSDDDAADDDVTPMPPDAGMPEDGGTFALVSSTPAHEATQVATNTGLVLEWNRDVSPGEGAISIVETLSAAVVEAAPVGDVSRVTFAGPEVTVTWSTTLAHETSYSVVVDQGAIQDADGRPFQGLDQPGMLVFSTVAPPNLELVSTSPLHQAVDVPLDTDLVLTFDGDVIAGQTGYLSVISAADGSTVDYVLLGDTTLVTIDGAVVTVDLPADLAYSTDYYVTLDPDAIQSVDGAAFGGFSDETVMAFSTVAPPEVVLVSTTPPDGAVDIDPGTPLVLTFSEPVEAAAGTVSVFEVIAGTLVETIDVLSAGVLISNDTLTVDLTATLGNSTEYYVLVDAGAIQSLIGGAFDGIADPTVFSFTTAAAPPPPLTLVSTVPAAGASNVPVDSDIALTFSEAVRVGTGNVSVFAANGSLFEVVSVTSIQVTIDGSTASVDLDGNLSGNTTYYVLVTAGSFESLLGASFAGVSDPAAIRFSTEDTFSLSSLSPADDATGVNVATNLVLTFSEPVALGTGAISVVRTSGAVVLETVTIPDSRVTTAGAVVTVDLDGLLDGNTGYHVLVDAGSITEQGGSDVYEGTSTATQWNFTTASVTKPGSVSAGLLLWLDADYAASVKTDSSVRYWADRSGQRNDVSNSASGERPTRVGNAIGTRAAVRFDGANDWLYAADGLDLVSAEGFIVWRSSSAPSTEDKRSLFVNGENLEVNHGHPFVANSVVTCVSSPCEGSSYYVAEVAPGGKTNTTTLWSFGFDSVTTSLFASAQGGNISFQPGPTTTGILPTFPLGIGGHDEACAATDGCYFDGDIGEVILYSRRLTQAERLAVVSYLRTKWSVPQVACSAGETLGDNGHCYYLHTTSLDWTAARDNCTSRGDGWNLATVRSQLDEDEIIEVLAPVNDAWIGASDSEVANTWRWVTDTLQFWSGASASSGGVATNGSFANWRASEPSAGGDEACGRYNLNAGVWSWADVGCQSLYNSLCQGPGD